MTHCHKCGKKNDDESKFCADCGAKLKMATEKEHSNKTSSNFWKNAAIFMAVFVGLVLIGLFLRSGKTPAPTCQDVQVPYEIQEPYTDYESKSTASSKEMTVTSGSASNSGVYTIPISVQKDGELYITASSSSSSVAYFFGKNDGPCQLDGLAPLVGQGSGTSFSATYSNARANTVYCLVISHMCADGASPECYTDFRETHNIKLKYEEYTSQSQPVTKYTTVTKYRTEQRCS